MLLEQIGFVVDFRYKQGVVEIGNYPDLVFGRDDEQRSGRLRGHIGRTRRNRLPATREARFNIDFEVTFCVGFRSPIFLANADRYRRASLFVVDQLAQVAPQVGPPAIAHTRIAQLAPLDDATLDCESARIANGGVKLERKFVFRHGRQREKTEKGQ